MDKITITNQREIEPLNFPSNWEEINTSSIKKYASSEKTFEQRVADMDLGGFDIVKAVSENLDHLFVKVFAIKKDEVNDNGDYFSEHELKKAAKTFIGVPVFVNHQNDDIEKARGKVVHAWWDDERGGIYTINMVDKIAYPRLARGIEAGYVTGSSMGCSVKYSCCSICHNRAANAKEYCSHIRERKKKTTMANRNASITRVLILAMSHVQFAVVKKVKRKCTSTQELWCLSITSALSS